ncbi:MAG: hypothetical protein JRJ73_16130 [Deltaproteobacteria bacterium]|nr:hypothetical protein [Deltaproteobacteria bacterium]
MQKLDTSCGISKKELYIIKYNVKNEILRQLPVLPDPIETKLFLEGRDAWVYSWSLLNDKSPIGPKERIDLEVVAKLKREFHIYNKKTHYHFSCKVKRQKDLYHPKISISKKIA